VTSIIVGSATFKEKDMVKRHGGFFLVLALLAPAAFAQPQSTTPSSSQHQQEMNMQRQGAHIAKSTELGDRQAARDSLANLAKLHAGLAQAWQHMGLSPEAAQRVANAYDPNLASQMHHTSLHGKTDDQIAGLLRDAVAANHFLVADQLLIDYQRQKLSMNEMTAGDSHETLSGR
jgi:hypothetical protein